MPATHGPMSTPRAAQAGERDEQQHQQRDVAEHLDVEPPRRCSHLTGAIRNAATSVPTTIAITNETTTRRTVTQKPERNSDQYSVRTSSKRLLVVA